MFNKSRKAIAVVVMALVGAGLYAQSNQNLSTAELFNTDVDNFIGVNDFGKVLGGDEPKSFFVYSRLGQGTLNGNLELGTGVRISDGLYVGALYNGWFQADQAKSDGAGTTIQKNGKDDETRTFYKESRNGKPLTLEALVGLGKLGIKVGYVEELKINGADYGKNSYLGWVKPYVDVGFGGGILSEAKLTFNIQRDEYIALAGSGSSFTSSGNSVGGSSDQSGSMSYSSLKNLIDDDDNLGSYVEPELYVNLDLGLGGFAIENTLGVRIYTNSAADKKDAKSHHSAVAGLALWSTTYNNAGSDQSSFKAVWDNKFYLNDKIVPQYSLGNGDEEALRWKVKFLLPINIGIDTDEYSALVEQNGKSAKADKFNNESTFNFGLAPTVRAGVAFKPADIVDLHVGIEANLFDWTVAASSTKKTTDSDGNFKTSGDDAVASNLPTYSPASADSSSSVSTFTGPIMSFGAGATFYLGPCALDLILLKGARPTIDGMLYEAISGGLNAAIVLSAKF